MAVGGGIVGIALGAAAVQRLAHRLCERRIDAQSLDQVGVADEVLAERDHVGAAALHDLDRHCTRVAVVDDPRALRVALFEARAQRDEVERRVVARAAGRAFDDVDERELERCEFVNHQPVHGLRVGVGPGIVGGRDRREANAGAAGADLVGDRGHHLHHQPRAVFMRAAVGIGAVVDAVAHELLEQVAVGAVYLDAVEAGGDGVAGGVAVVGDQARDFVGAQRARLGNILEALRSEGLAFRALGGARHRHHARRQQREVRDAAHMPELHDDLAALGVNRVGDLLPARDLFFAVDARRVEVALAFGRNLRALGDDQPGAGALLVVRDHQRGGHLVRAGTVAGEWCHHDAVGGGDIAEMDRIEQRGHAATFIEMSCRRCYVCVE